MNACVILGAESKECLGACLPSQHPSVRRVPRARRISYAKDTKVVNAGTFTVQREDHTLGHLIRM